MCAEATSLDRFLEAQDEFGEYEGALEELRAGCKRSHWIWFVFPQLRGLGMSSTSEFFGIADLDEAGRYLAHPVLGKRLHEASEALLASGKDDPEEILGGIDAMKVRSCMTLFLQADPNDAVLQKVLDVLYDGKPDARTLELLDNRTRPKA